MKSAPASVAAALALGLLAAWPCRAAPGDPLDRADLGRETFVEHFRQRVIDPAKWAFNFWYGDQKGPSSRVYGAGDLQVFASPAYDGVDPFGPRAGRHLVIHARPVRSPDDPLNGGRRYTSGLLTTFASFSQRYGYFEARLRADDVPGMWPAFWLLARPSPETKDMEIDVMEGVGTVPTTAFQSTHYVTQAAPGVAPVSQIRTYPAEHVNWGRYHTYGVLVTPTRLVFYVDGRETAREDNTGRFDMPLYLALSLGIGPASWSHNAPGPNFRGGRMEVNSVRTYALAPGAR